MKPGQQSYRLLSIVLSAGFCVLIIILLYIFSEHANHRPNGFIRLFPPHPISARYYKDIVVSSYYIAGVTDREIYLNNQSAPAYLYIIDHTLENPHFLKFSVPKNLLFTKGTVMVHVDSPDVILDSYKNSLLLSGSLASLNLNVLDNKMDFFKCEPISSSSYIFRAENQGHNQNLIIKKNYFSSEKNDTANLLDPDKKGVITTDGILFYDKNFNYLFYVYYYQNLFICLDSNLKELYRGRTIDTINNPQIKLTSINSENDIVHGAPPLMVNRNSCANGKWLFVQSALLADNEPKGSLDSGSVIDVYQGNNGQYKLSFYIPNDHNTRLKYFRAFKNELIVLYDHTMFLYKLNF